MDIDNIKDLIKKHFLTKNGKVNIHSIKKKRLDENGLGYILDFLDSIYPNFKFHEQVYFLFNR